MNNEEIKVECELAYKQIRDAEQRLKELRAICKHESTFNGKWSYRVGAINEAEICSYCGSLLRVLDLPSPEDIPEGLFSVNG